MSRQRVNPTRMELLRLKKRTVLAEKGHKLLKEKRDGLMQEFLSLITEVKQLREQVDEKLTYALHHLAIASAVMDTQAVRLLSLTQLQRVSAKVSQKNVMGVEIPKFDIHQSKGSGAYTQWATAPELDVAVSYFKEVMPLLLKLATKEKAAQLLALEIEKTRRRVNALEHVLIPQLRDTTRHIRMKLEEQARAAIVMTMKVKQTIV